MVRFGGAGKALYALANSSNIATPDALSSAPWNIFWARVPGNLSLTPK